MFVPTVATFAAAGLAVAGLRVAPATAVPPAEAPDAAPAEDALESADPAEAPEHGPAACVEPTPDHKALDTARALFESGVGHYEAAEYDQAVNAWYEALSLVPRTADNRKIRAEIVYNVARAQEKAYDIDRDPRHLRRARRALERFLEEVDAVYPEAEAPRERAQAEERIAEIDRKIAEAEAEARRREKERLEAMRPKFDPVLDRRQHRRNVSMLGTGAGLFVLGAGALGMMGAGLAIGRTAESDLEDLSTTDDLDERRRVMDRGALGNRLAVAGAVTGGVLVLVGLPLLIAGAAFEKERRAYKASFAVVPAVGRGGFALRFGRR